MLALHTKFLKLRQISNYGNSLKIKKQRNIKKRGGEINAADQPWAQPEEKAFPS